MIYKSCHEIIFIISTINLQLLSHITDGHIHYVGKFIGESVSLMCEVDYQECGKIYFLTFSKNVSGEWQRVYLYSETYQTALGDLAFGGGQRVSLDASNMTTTGIAYLNIGNIGVEDESTYKCDVTYVHGSCPSLTYTQLNILGKWTHIYLYLIYYT